MGKYLPGRPTETETRSSGDGAGKETPQLGGGGGWRRVRDLPWKVLGLGRAGGGRAVGVISVWALWERFMLRIHRLEPARPGGLFRFQVVRYKGADHRLADGTVVRPGDRLVELHLDNRGFVAMRGRKGYSTWKAVHELRLDVEALRSRIEAGELGPVAAFHGVSLLGPAGGILGFESRELPHNWRNAFVFYFLAGIDAVYHPTGLERIKGHVRRRWPTEVWLSARRPAARAASR